MRSRLLITLFLLCHSVLASVGHADNNGMSHASASGLIIYGINLRDFTGTPGKALGDGTAAGMMKSVAALKNHGGTPFDYLVQLGVNAIQFTPTDACGNADDYRSLIEASHAGGLAVILDMTSSDIDSYASLDNLIKDYSADGVWVDVDAITAQSLHNCLAEKYPDIYFINRHASDQNSDGIIGTTNLNNPSCRYVSGQLDDASLDGFRTITSPLTISYAESHDTDRVAYRARLDGVSGVKGTGATAATNRLRRLGSLAAQMLMSPGPHMIWQFEELGADQISLNADGTPNQAPKTVLWNNLNNQLYLSLHDTYVALCNVRRQYPRLFDGSASCRTSLSSAAERYISLSDGETDLFLVVNPAVSGNAVITPVDASTGNPVNLTTSVSRLLVASPDVTPTVSASGVSLPGGAFAVYVRDHESAIDCIPSDSHPTPHIDIINGVITPLEKYDSLTIRTTSGVPLPHDSRLHPGIYLVTLDGITIKVVVR